MNNINSGNISGIYPNNNQMTYTGNTTYLGGYTYPVVTNVNTIGAVGAVGAPYTTTTVGGNNISMGYRAGGGGGAGGGYYSMNTTLPYTYITANQLSNNQIYNTMDPSWYDQFSQLSIKVGEETKTFNKREITEILEKYIELIQLCDEFPQVRHFKDKLDAIIKLHLNPDDNAP
jgi:hypothetical protein